MDNPQQPVGTGEVLAGVLAGRPPHLKLVIPAGKPSGAELARRDAVDAARDGTAMTQMRERQRKFRRHEWEESLRRASRFRSASMSLLTGQQDPHGAVSGWLDSGTLTLLLHGPSRTGKTYAAYAVGNAAHEAGLWVTGWHVLDLLDQLRPNDSDPDAARRAWRSASESDVLILDDLGTESRTAWTLEQVMRLLDARSRNDRRTAVTTNLQNEQDIIGAYGERIFYRLTESPSVVEVKGEVLLPVPGFTPANPGRRGAAGASARDHPLRPA